MKKRPDKQVRLDGSDASLISSLVQFPNIPTETKLELIMEITEEYRTLGQVIAGVDREFAEKTLTKSEKKAVSRFEKWAASNRR